MEEKKLTDEELKKAFFILRHGSSEGLSEYVKAVLAIESEYNRQKAEIERLKDEFKTDYRNSWKNKFFGVLEENQELQKQVDELKEKSKEVKEKVKEKVKDTAKEICLKIIKDQPQPIKEKWVEWFKEECGVEVE